MLQVKFHDHKKTFACGKRKPWLVAISLLEENFLDEGKILVVENFLDEGKLLACDNFPDKAKISTCTKPPWWNKNIGLLKSSFIVEK